MNGRKKTNGQVRAIFGLAKLIGLDREALRELVADVVTQDAISRRASIRDDADSIKSLSYSEAEKVIQRLKGKSFVPLRTLQYRRAKSGVKQMVTAELLKKIAELASQRDWSAETLQNFCIRQCKHAKPLTTSDANKVIEALKAMNERDHLWAA